MLILGLLGMYFDAVVVFVTSQTLLFRLALAILCTNKVDLKPRHSLIVPSKLKGYLEDTFKEDNVKVKEVIFTYHRKDVAKIRNKLEKVERALDYCRKSPRPVKLYKLYLFCGTPQETALEYYKKRGLHFKSMFSLPINSTTNMNS